MGKLRWVLLVIVVVAAALGLCLGLREVIAQYLPVSHS